jgi:hypothetical protein
MTGFVAFEPVVRQHIMVGARGGTKLLNSQLLGSRERRRKGLGSWYPL